MNTRPQDLGRQPAPHTTDLEVTCQSNLTALVERYEQLPRFFPGVMTMYFQGSLACVNLSWF